MEEAIYFIKEFEGIIGAVLGVVATLITTDILKRLGKLNIYVMNSTGNFNYNVNGFIQKDRESKEDKLCGYDHKLVLNLYNSSDSPKFLRDLKMNVFNEEEFLFSIDMQDEDTRRFSAGISRADDAKIYNIEPKIAIELNLSFYLTEEDYRKINNNKKVRFVISYINDKNKIKKIDIFNNYLKEPRIKKRINKN